MYSSSAEKMFYEMGDLNEKKSIARSARHKVGRSKSSRIRLSSDHLTRKEWSAMNGPVVAFDFRNTTLQTLKTYPTEIRYEFFKLMAEKFNATQAALAQEMGCTQRNICYYIAKAGASDLFPIHRMTTEQRNALHHFFCPTDAVAAPDETASTSGVSSTLNIDEPADQQSETNQTELDNTPLLPSLPVNRQPLMMMKEVNMQFVGEFFPQQVCNTLLSLLEPGTKCKINISCELIET